LYYACLAGLSWVARDLPAEGADVNVQGGEYGNALQAASYNGDGDITQLLLDKGADVNAQTLLAASHGDNPEIVQSFDLKCPRIGFIAKIVHVPAQNTER
jgi:ankyrin repeat protein